MAKKNSKSSSPKVPGAGKRLVELRKKLKLSSVTLGLKCGYSHGYIRNLCRQASEPNVEFLTVVCNAFHVNPQWLIDGKPKAKMFVQQSGEGEKPRFTNEVPPDMNDIVPEDRNYTARAYRLEIGGRIKKIRSGLGLTLVEFGERIGVTGSSISPIELGQRMLTEAMAMRIGKAFDVGVDWLYYGDEKAREYPLDDEMIKWINSHPEVRKEIKRKMRE